ncbi:Transcription intermediary factor 1-beta, partial [Orchesella cincta]
MVTLETEPVPSTSATPAEPKKDLPWMKCVAGCVVDENLEVISLRCFHSICSEGCVLKLKRQSQKHGEEEKLFCGQCGLHIEEGDLQRKLTPSKVFISKPDASIKCEHCVLNTNAVAYCPDCPACLCEECKRMHPLTRVTQHHKVQDSLEGYKPKEQPDKKCDLHGGAAKIFYCYSCNEKICARCKPNHERHVVINMVNAQEKLKTTAESASALHERSCGAAKDIEHKLDELKSSWSSIIGEINDEFAMLLISLMGRQDRIKFEAKRKFLKKLADIQTTSYSVAKVKSHSGNIVKVIDEIVNNRDELAAANFL